MSPARAAPFSLTASMRGSGFAVVVAPGSGVAIVSTGEVDFLKPSSLIRSQYYANRCTDEHELRVGDLRRMSFASRVAMLVVIVFSHKSGMPPTRKVAFSRLMSLGGCTSVA